MDQTWLQNTRKELRINLHEGYQLKSSVFRFCRTKCRRLFNRKKNPRKAKWTKAFRKSAGKELAVDPTFDLEKKRNIPIKYNRELWAKTMEAMKSIVEIRERRENKFVMDRLVKDFKNKKMQYRHLVRDHLNLVRSPAAGLRRGNVVIDEEDLEQDVMKRIIAEVSKKKPKRQLNKEELAKEEDMSEDEKIEEDDDDDEIDTDSDDNEDGGDDEEGEEDDEDGEGEAGGEEEEDSGSDVEMSSDEEEQE